MYEVKFFIKGFGVDFYLVNAANRREAIQMGWNRILNETDFPTADIELLDFYPVE